MEYSCSSSRGADEARTAPRARSAGSTHDSVVVWLADHHDMNLPSRVRASAQVEALVVVLIDQHVAGVRRAKRVPPKLVLALLLLVLDGVKKRAIVGGPDDRADALDLTRRASRRSPGL